MARSIGRGVCRSSATRSDDCLRRRCGPSSVATRTMRRMHARSGRRLSSLASRRLRSRAEEQQAVLALHRMRQELVKFRSAQINGLRGLLAEYGEVMPQGQAGMRRGIAPALERVFQRLPAMVVESLREQWARVARNPPDSADMSD